MSLIVNPHNDRHSLMPASAEFAANSFSVSQHNEFVLPGPDPAFQTPAWGGVAANLFQSLDEFIPVGIVTGFGQNGRLTLKMLRRFANIPHVLLFGRLHLSNVAVGSQSIEFIPMAVTTSFGNGESVPLKMLSQRVNIPHVLCFGRLKCAY